MNAQQDEIVYAFQIPLPRDDKVLRLNRLFQTMTSIMQLQVVFPPTLNKKEAGMFSEEAIAHEIPLNVKLAYRNTNDYDDVWHVFAKADLNKQFSCLKVNIFLYFHRKSINEIRIKKKTKPKSQYSLDCDMIQLFELGSVHHEFYLINVKLGESNLLEKDSLTKKLYLHYEMPEVRLVLTVIYHK